MAFRRAFVFFLLLYSFTSVSKNRDYLSELREARKYLDNHPDSAFYLAEGTLQSAKNRNSSFGVVKSYYFLGYFHKSLGNHVKALSYYLQGLDHARIASYENSASDVIGLLRNSAVVFRQLDRTEMSIQYLNEAIEVSLREGLKDEYCRLLYSKSDIQYRQGDYEFAWETLSPAFHHFPELRAKTIANIYNLSGLIRSNLGEPQEAISLYQRLLEFIKDKEDLYVNHKGYTLQNLGSVYLNDDNLTLAISYFHQAIDFKSQHNAEPSSLFISYKDLGETYLLKGDLKQGRVSLMMAMELYPYSKTIDKSYEVFELIARLESEDGDFKVANSYLSRYASELKSLQDQQQDLASVNQQHMLDLVMEKYYERLAREEYIASVVFYGKIGTMSLVFALIAAFGWFYYRKVSLRKQLEKEFRPLFHRH